MALRAPLPRPTVAATLADEAGAPRDGNGADAAFLDADFLLAREDWGRELTDVFWLDSSGPLVKAADRGRADRGRGPTDDRLPFAAAGSSGVGLLGLFRWAWGAEADTDCGERRRVMKRGPEPDLTREIPPCSSEASFPRHVGSSSCEKFSCPSLDIARFRSRRKSQNSTPPPPRCRSSPSR